MDILIIKDKKIIGYSETIKEAKEIIRKISKMKGLTFREGDYLIVNIIERFRIL